ncbi:ferritin-like protein [Pseudoalteromonas sp. DL2-H2.2]|uniref:ferritin-like domain-containing protein n=1 Tax=Pseudoalteromonas sp. DL2-H2.2 TaxID=2908889 RepID=UPI001F26CBFC|nr:ferritin-like protein [Pseudoalteromonas sp. DL2-H2.2]MCF2907709.1 ferritin-like protein [Pseudoalteromonas sp. DL2-H2.2]
MYHKLQKRPIETLEQLHYDLQLAIELEFSTLPVYLTALYSIEEGTNQCAYTVIRSVVMEEMFHLTNAANLLIATGGSPAINSPEFLPTFPTKLPDGETWFEADLQKFSPEALQNFLNIEMPAALAKEGDITIGEFYAGIENGLQTLHERYGPELFPADCHDKQIAHKYYYGGGGEITPVTDLASANFALNAIIAQGEGVPDDCWDPDQPFPLGDTTGIGSGDHQLFMQPRELSHYYRFNELLLGYRYAQGDTPNSGPTGPAIPIDYHQVYNVVKNPQPEHYQPYPAIARLDTEFNLTLSLLLDQLHLAFNGQPDLLVAAVGTMFGLKEKAQSMMRVPLPDDSGQYATPTWRYIAAKDRPGGC